MKDNSISMMILHPSGETGAQVKHEDDNYENHMYYFKIVTKFIEELKKIFLNKSNNLFNERVHYSKRYEFVLKNNDSLNKDPLPEYETN